MQESPRNPMRLDNRLGSRPAGCGSDMRPRMGTTRKIANGSTCQGLFPRTRQQQMQNALERATGRQNGRPDQQTDRISLSEPGGAFRRRDGGELRWRRDAREAAQRPRATAALAGSPSPSPAPRIAASALAKAPEHGQHSVLHVRASRHSESKGARDHAMPVEKWAYQTAWRSPKMHTALTGRVRTTAIRARPRAAICRTAEILQGSAAMTLGRSERSSAWTEESTAGRSTERIWGPSPTQHQLFDQLSACHNSKRQ